MRSFYHNICSVSLTKDLFDELVLEAESTDYNVHLISPLGNIFLIGDTDQIEEIEWDDTQSEYIIVDAGGTVRRIMFRGNMSNYGILINEHNTPGDTTGISAEDADKSKDKEFLEWFRAETGLVGQEVQETEEEDGE